VICGEEAVSQGVCVRFREEISKLVLAVLHDDWILSTSESHRDSDASAERGPISPFHNNHATRTIA
jgi:hypothetical protein